MSQVQERGLTSVCIPKGYLDEKVRPMGCQVLHDVPADSFNIDHVVVGLTGLFAVETKTHSPCDGRRGTAATESPDHRQVSSPS